MFRQPSTDGVVLALHELGGQGPTVLLAHANGFHGRVFGPLAAHLAPGLRCVAVDLRGHGETTFAPDVPLDWPRFAGDVLAAVAAVGGPPVLGVGHSLGGAALAMAEQDQPGTFRALYLYEPILPPPMDELTMPMNPMAEAARRRRNAFPGTAAAVAHYGAKPPLDALHPDALQAYVEHGFAPAPDGTVTLRCPPEIEARIFERIPPAERFHRLDEVQCPVTVAVGRAGEVGPARFSPAVAARFGRGRLERFDDLGHFGPLEDPALVAASILAAFAGAHPS